MENFRLNVFPVFAVLRQRLTGPTLSAVLTNPNGAAGQLTWWPLAISSQEQVSPDAND